jgi:uncharacterized membrane protein
MSTYDRAKYLKNKDKLIPAQIASNKLWLARQPPEYKDYVRAVCRKAALKHYENNREKILAYKKRYFNMKKEIQGIMNLYAIYE